MHAKGLQFPVEIKTEVREVLHLGKSSSTLVFYIPLKDAQSFFFTETNSADSPVWEDRGMPTPSSVVEATEPR